MSEKNRIIIFSQEGETLDNISLTAKEYGFDRISVSDGKNSRELLENGSYSLVVVNAPLEEEFGLELAVFAAKKGCGVIISASSKVCGEIAKKIGSLDIFVLPRPLNKALLLQTFRFVMLSKEHSNVLQNEKEQLESKLRDVRLIDRAKCVLVEYLRISEADAHRQIQKRAMDMRVSQVTVAQDILKTYEM